MEGYLNTHHETYIDHALFYIGENNPPNPPTIKGPTSGKPGIPYTYCIESVVDPDGDSLYVFWSWGDGCTTGWLGPYISGEDICVTHTWNKKGSYTITVKIKDEFGATATASLKVIMPRNRAINLWSSYLKEKLPLLSQLLNLLN